MADRWDDLRFNATEGEWLARPLGDMRRALADLLAERDALAVEVDHFRPAALPVVGSVWRWEPEKPHAREAVIVTAVRWNGEEWLVECDRLNEPPTFVKAPLTPAGKPVWNDLSRWVEATVFVAAALTEETSDD